MNLRVAFLIVTIFFVACEDSPVPPRPFVDVSISASPIEPLVDRGWADINGNAYRMDVEGDSLVVRDLEIPPGELAIDVRAVDANQTDLLAGIAFGRAEADSEALLIQVPLTPSRPDLVLVGFSTLPEEPVAGDLVTIQVDVSNSGSGSSGPTTLTVRVGSEAQGENLDVPAMAPGQALRFDRVVELTQATVYQVLAFVDPRNQVPEVINTNNAAIGLITVGPAP
jgi:hypothetical protein